MELLTFSSGGHIVENYEELLSVLCPIEHTVIVFSKRRLLYLTIKEYEPRMNKKDLAMCLIVVGLCFIWTATAFAAPKIEFGENLTFDFGNVKANETLTHEFVFKNIGDVVLKIDQVKGG
jgi:hypothetical protein